MSENSNTCPKLQSDINKQKQLGRGKFGIVRTWGGDKVVKIEDCDKIEYKKKGFVPDLENRKKVIQPLVSAGLTPAIVGKSVCGNKCISFYKRVNGVQLAEAIKRSSKDEAMRLIKKGISTIESMHNLLSGSYSHGDLHTGNMMLTDKGRIKIIDFSIERGLSRAYDWQFFFESVQEDAGQKVTKDELVDLIRENVPQNFQGQVIRALK